MSEQAPKRAASRWVGGVALVSAAYLAYLLVISIAQAENAEEAGYVVGVLLGAVAVAIAARFIYVRLRPAQSRPSFWSPWIIVLAALILLLLRIANAVGNVASR